MLQAHERLGDFEIIRLLGKGGMGEVYEALQFNPERRVALKVLSPWLATDDDALERFWREARVPANLDHPGIVRIISTGKTPAGVAFYTMQLVRGLSLAELIRRANAASAGDLPTRSVASHDTPSAPAPNGHDLPVSPAPSADSTPPCLADYRHDRFPTVARIGAQAARALAHAHQQGHLHRDIKPSNLMVDVHNHVYLVDFGLTRALQPTGDATQSGAVVGTPWYMSPEQAEGMPLDERSDIYALGVALFELATQGLGPFTASRDNKQAVLAQVRAGQTLPLRTLAPGIPPALERIVVRAMEHKPKRRHASAAALALELEAISAPTPPSAPRSARPRTWRHKTALIAAALLAIVIGIAAAALNWPDQRVPDQADAAKQEAVAISSPQRLDGSKALPEILRDHDRGIGVRIPLQKGNHDPIWWEPIVGNGMPGLMPGQLQLTSPPHTATVIALADPDWPNFEYAIQLNQLTPKKNARSTNQIGIVFGWQRAAQVGLAPRCCFLVQLDESPAAEEPLGRLTLGTAQFITAPNMMPFVDWLKPLPGAHATIPLSKSHSWHDLKVRVAPDRFWVSVDGTVPREFRLADVFRTEPDTGAQPKTTAAIGIWTRDGTAFFKNATLMLLPAD